MKTIIGIIGEIGAGKDSAADHIAARLSVNCFQLSSVLKDLALERDINPVRENLVLLGTKVAKEFGSDYLVKAMLEKINDQMVVITGMRHLGQIEYLRKNTRLILIAITSKPELRFARAQKRGKAKAGEAKTLEDFIAQEKAENSGAHDQRLYECLKLADYAVENNTDLGTLFNHLDLILKKEGLL